MADLTPQISIDPNLGVARLGTTEVAIAVREAAIHLIPPNGPVLRQLSFGERNQVVWAAVGSIESRLSACHGVSKAAVVESGECDESVLEATALALAGAALDAPSFVESALLVAKASGWNPQELARMPAIEVDRMAMQLAPGRDEEPGWNRIVFAAPGDSVETLRDELADNLLRRARISPTDRVVPDRGSQSDGVSISDGRPASQLTERSQRSPVSSDPYTEGSVLHQLPDKAAAAVSSVDLRTDPEPATEDDSQNPSPETDFAKNGYSMPPTTDWRPDSSLVGRSGNDFPRSGIVKSAFADSEKHANTLAWDGLSTQPSRQEALVSAEQSSRSIRLNVVPDFDSELIGTGALQEAAQAKPARNQAVFDGDQPLSRLVAESLPGSGFVTSGDAIAEADAIAALLHQEADLRGIDR